MTDILFILVLFCNIFVVIFFFKVIFPREGITSPIFIVLFFYLLQYPIRAICLYLSIDTSFESIFDNGNYSFNSEEIVEALIYASLYCFLLVGSYTIFSNNHIYSSLDINKNINIKTNNLQSTAIFILFFAYVSVFFYRFMNGDIYSLYYELDDLKRPFLVNLLYIIMSLKWFWLAYWFLCFLKKKFIFFIGIIFNRNNNNS